jgi:hypothetical protein
MQSRYTKIETLFHKIIQNMCILNINIIYMDLYHIYSVIKCVYIYIGVTDKSNALAVDR